MADADARTGHRNHLAGETSPYLLQHAGNPVDWYPWGDEALARARLLDRPIFLSIGYAACHWCHVMERESFEDEATAAILNAHFVPIKVDREERPDLDQLYMGAVQALTGQGGWPMSVFLAPDGRPFYGGTYYPDTPRHGMPSFRQVLEAIRAAWAEQRDEVERAGARLVEALVAGQATAPAADQADGLPTAEVLGRAAAGIAGTFDPVNGGWGRAPKFPQPMTIEALLLRHAATGDPRPLEIARRSLDAMAAGGVRDQLGGGFHRYATDAAWLVPHFEQMLYDNAQLARVYVHAWALTGDASYLDTATGTLDYLLRELRTADGGFAASQDADTDGLEGGTFTWTAAEVREVLGPDAALFSAAYGVTDGGNWEGRTILSRVRDGRELSERFGLAAEDVAARLAASRAAPPGPPGRASPAGAGRQGAGRVERPRDRRPGRRRTGAGRLRRRDPGRGRRALPGCGRDRRDGGPHGIAPGGRPAPAFLEGRAGDRRRGPRGSREPCRGPAGAVRGHPRRALVHRLRLACRGDARPVHRPDGWLLRHRR